MLARAFTFGDTPCLVEVTGVPPMGGPPIYEAKLYVLEHDGLELRRVGDRTGEPVEIFASTEEDAMGQAAMYLEQRFGSLGTASPPKHEWVARTINYPPLKDERPVSEGEDAD